MGVGWLIVKKITTFALRFYGQVVSICKGN